MNLTPEQAEQPESHETLLGELKKVAEKLQSVSPELLHQMEVQGSIKIEGHGNVLGHGNLVINILPPSAVSSNTAALYIDIGQYATLLSREQREKLDRIHEKFRQGKVVEARNECRAIRDQSEFWNRLTPSDQSRTLQQLARYELDLAADIDVVRGLIKQARKLDPDIDDTIIRVMLHQRECGAEAALAELGIPKTTSSYNLRLSLLFQLGQYTHVLTEIQNPPSEISPDTDTQRFHALALLATGELKAAREKIAVVLAEHGEEEFVQLAAAMIDYWSGMATNLDLPKITPVPPLTRLVVANSDPESLQFFRNAEQRFAALIDSTQRGEEQKNYFEVWRLACIANDLTRQQEAEACCQEILTRNPTQPYVLLWAITRGYSFDTQNCEAALDKRLNEAIDSVDEEVDQIVMTLFDLYRVIGMKEKVQPLLDRTKEFFTNDEVRHAWIFMQAQQLLENSEIESAKRFASQIENEELRRRINTVILRAEANTTQDFTVFVHHLETCFQDTSDTQYLLELCEYSAQLGEWATISKYAQQLILQVGNPYVVQLIAIANWNEKRHLSCLEVLENHQIFFPERQLPDDLRRLKIMCLLRAGKTSDAVAEARAVAHDSPTTVNLLTGINAHLQMGNLRELTVIAATLEPRTDLPFDAVARMSRLLSSFDVELAKKYLLRSRDELLDHPQYAAFLYDTSARLNLEGELGPVFRKIVDSHPEEVTKVQAIPTKDFPEQQQRAFESWQRTINDYGRGDLPLHWIASKGRISMVEWLHAIPEQNRVNISPRKQTAIYARHGGHLVKTYLSENSSNWQIHADITSLILAESLGILDKVEKTFGAIVISPSVQQSLTWQMNNLLPQTSRVKTCQHILQMADEERFLVALLEENVPAQNSIDTRIGKGLLSLLHKARNEGGYVVAYLPLSTLEGDLITIPDEFATSVMNCRAVLESMKMQGCFTVPQYQEVRQKLGSEGAKEAIGPTLTEKTRLFLDGNIAETLAGAGLLAETCEYFDVYVDTQQIEWAKQQIWLNQHCEQLQALLRGLIDRLRAGLEIGKYRTICIPEALAKDIQEDSDSDSLEMKCVSELLFLESQADNVLWIDDRFFNRFPSGGNGSPIIAVSEVLAALKSRGKLSEREYYEKLLALRSGNFRYIPLNQFEILYHLKKASLKQERSSAPEIIETKDLKKLRCSIAACLLDEGKWRAEGEQWFLHSVAHTVKAAIFLLWKDRKVSLDRTIAYSNWIFENLFVSPLGFVHLFDPETITQSFADAMGEILGEYLTNGIVLKHTRQPAYLKWLSERILNSCLNADGETIVATAKSFRNYLGNLNVQNERTPEEQLTLTYLMFRKLDLPSELAEALGKELIPDPEVCRKLGLPSFEYIRIGSYIFSPEKLTEAVNNAYQSGSAIIQTAKEKEILTIVKGTSLEPGTESFRLQNASGKTLLSVLDDVWKLLSEDISVREVILLRNRDWFDCDQQTFEQEVKEIAALEIFVERLDRVEKRRRKSAAIYYELLPQFLNEEASPSWSDMMPPSISELLQHWRFEEVSNDFSVEKKLSASATQLITEEGLGETLERFACLPTRMPELLVCAVMSLSRAERIKLIRDCSTRWASPISSLHLVDLVLRVGDEKDDFLAIARSALTWLFDDEGGSIRFSLFHHTLQLVNIGLSRVTKNLDITTKLLLVWAHAAKLHNIYGQIGEGVTFPWVTESSKWERIYADKAYLTDALHPSRVRRPVFLVNGLSVIFSNHNKKVIDDLKIVELLNSVTTKSYNEGQMPVLELISNPTCLTNQTNSFLGGDRIDSIRSVLGDSIASLISPDSLNSCAKEALEKLKNDPGQPEQWFMISLISNDLPLPSDLAAVFYKIVKDIDLQKIYQNSPESVVNAFRVLSVQIPNLNDEALLRAFEEDLLLIALQENQNQQKSKIKHPQITEIIFDVALNMVFRNSDKPSGQRKTKGLLLKLVENSTHFRDLIPGLFRVIHELPPDKAWQLWPVLLAARSTS